MTLFDLQTRTRIILASDRFTKVITRTADTSQDECDTPNSSQGEAVSVLKRILSILYTYGPFEEDISYPARALEVLRAVTRRGPPGFSHYHYIYGLLDCATQLGRILDGGHVPQEFEERMKQVILRSRNPSFRWKAVSFP